MKRHRQRKASARRGNGGIWRRNGIEKAAHRKIGRASVAAASAIWQMAIISEAAARQKIKMAKISKSVIESRKKWRNQRRRNGIRNGERMA